MEAVTYSVPEEGLAVAEAGAAAMLVAAAGALPDLAVLELTFFAPPVVAAVAAAVVAQLVAAPGLFGQQQPPLRVPTLASVCCSAGSGGRRLQCTAQRV